MHITQATTKQAFSDIELLADTIWRDHYIPIVGKSQVDYMLDQFQTAKAIENQVQAGMSYFVMYLDDAAVGYFAIKPEETNMFLSKIYVLKTQRNKGIAKNAIHFILEQVKSKQLKGIRLTVNINNEIAIKAYKKLGFTITKPIVADIGNGFVMDDYEMVKRL